MGSSKATWEQQSAVLDHPPGGHQHLWPFPLLGLVVPSPHLLISEHLWGPYVCKTYARCYLSPGAEYVASPWSL